VHQDKDIVNDRLEIPTHEIAGVIAEAMVNIEANKGDRDYADFAEKVMPRLIQAGRYVGKSLVHLQIAEPPQIGWCSDHAYGVEIVESWTSAIVLQSLLHLIAFVDSHRRRLILDTFVTVSPSDRDWPDWLRWDRYVTEGEVDRQYPVLEYLDKTIIRPIRNDPRGVPPASPRSVSVLLFGPPGTSKTTIVKAVADGLKWPLVFLTPGDFIDKGLEYIEAQTRLVFRRLMDLSRAVVLFDECDELFRDRRPLRTTEQTRGITAFVTASMLPKLQELHDCGRIVFFICTNSFGTIDPAIKRGGRVDHVIAVPPPDEKARARIIKEAIVGLQGGEKWRHPATLIDSVVDKLAARTERFTRPEIGRAVRMFAARESVDDASACADVVERIVEQMADGLIIDDKEYKKFKELKRQFSLPVVEGGTGNA